jgi:Ca2+-transporting ATPase
VLIYGFVRTEWRQGLLAGLTLAMSLLPEEFPVVMTLFLTLGAYRMSRRNVLARRLAALETLGAATVLCSDKTGTLTENRMRVLQYASGLDGPESSSEDLSTDSERELAAMAALASPPQGFDAVDRAAIQFGTRALETGTYPQLSSVLREYPLSPELPVLAEARSWKGSVLVAAKGAPEAVASLCRCDDNEKARLHARVLSLASSGLRLLAVACGTVPADGLPARLEDVPLRFVGLIAMEDPLRPGVRAAINECHAAGVRVVMVTGDHPCTARAIAVQAGLDSAQVITGTELERLTGSELLDRVRTATVFARVTPIHKLKLVQALRDAGEVVAMTGDGVNDAPALRASHIGVAMGGRGTDVAREAADLVVLDDNFVSIVGAIRMGRRIYTNLQKSLAYVLSVHVPIAGMGLLPVILNWPLLFTPVHIVFLELIIDPACSIAFEMEPDEADTMRRPPRSSTSRLLGGGQILRSLLEGACVLIAIAVVFWVGMRKHAGAADARTLGFATLVLGNLSLIFVNRSRSRSLWQTLRARNVAWWGVFLGAFGALSATIYSPPLRILFQFSPAHWDDLAFCFIASAGVLAVLAVLRRGADAGRLSPAGGPR